MKLETLEACMQTFGKELYSFCLYLTRSRQEADDLYQDTLLKLMELREHLEFEKNPKGYLLSVSMHLWTNRKRKTAWRKKITGPGIPLEETAAEILSKEPSPEEQLITREEQMLVQQAVQRLPEKYRLPVLLFYMEEQKISEISRILNLPEGTVKTRLSRAKRILEKELEDVFHEKTDE